MQIELIKGQKYDVTDTFGMVIHKDSEYLGEILTVDLWKHSPTHVFTNGPVFLFKCLSEYYPNGFYTAVYVDTSFRNGCEIRINLRGLGDWHGSSVEEVLEKIRGPEYKVV